MNKLIAGFMSVALFSAAQAADLLITNARLIDGLGGVHKGTGIVVDNGQIVEISSGLYPPLKPPWTSPELPSCPALSMPTYT